MSSLGACTIHISCPQLSLPDDVITYAHRLCKHTVTAAAGRVRADHSSSGEARHVQWSRGGSIWTGTDCTEGRCQYRRPPVSPDRSVYSTAAAAAASKADRRPGKRRRRAAAAGGLRRGLGGRPWSVSRRCQPRATLGSRLGGRQSEAHRSSPVQPRPVHMQPAEAPCIFITSALLTGGQPRTSCRGRMLGHHSTKGSRLCKPTESEIQSNTS